MFSTSVQIQNYPGSNFQSVPVPRSPFNVVRSNSNMPPKRTGGIKKRKAQAEAEALLDKKTSQTVFRSIGRCNFFSSGKLFVDAGVAKGDPQAAR